MCVFCCWSGLLKRVGWMLSVSCAQRKDFLLRENNKNNKNTQIAPVCECGWIRRFFFVMAWGTSERAFSLSWRKFSFFLLILDGGAMAMFYLLLFLSITTQPLGKIEFFFSLTNFSHALHILFYFKYFFCFFGLWFDTHFTFHIFSFDFIGKKIHFLENSPRKCTCIKILIRKRRRRRVA